MTTGDGLDFCPADTIRNSCLLSVVVVVVRMTIRVAYTIDDDVMWREKANY